MGYIVNFYRCTSWNSDTLVDMTSLKEWYNKQKDFPWEVTFFEKGANVEFKNTGDKSPGEITGSLAELSKQFKKCNMYNSDVMVYDCTEFMKDPDLYYYHGGCIRINVTESENSIILNQYYTDGQSVETRF